MEYNVFNREYPNYRLGDWVGDHRKYQFYELVLYENHQLHIPVAGRIDGVWHVVCRLSCDEKWWVVVQNNDHLDDHIDIGPFDLMDEALFHLKMHVTEMMS